jgi:hypothetical protein
MLISFPYCVYASVLWIKFDARAAGPGAAGKCPPGAGPPVWPRLLLAIVMLNLLSGDT